MSNFNNHYNPIVSGSVIKTDQTKGLTIKLDDGRIGEVDIDQISDTDIGSIESYFKLFPKYKFKIIDEKNENLKLSYKLCHPKLIKDKKKIIPTCNHFSTLKKMIWFEIYLYDKTHHLNDVTTKKLSMNLDDIEIIKNNESNND